MLHSDSRHGQFVRLLPAYVFNVHIDEILICAKNILQEFRRPLTVHQAAQQQQLLVRENILKVRMRFQYGIPRPPPSIETSGLLQFLVYPSISTRVTCPLCSAGITPLRR